jgi:8-oxo-dGTP pyrophosphatase MutT (NUDIX family)
VTSSVLERDLRQADIARLSQRLLTREAFDATTIADASRRLAAVAAVLRVADEVPELLFIRRADKEGDPWSGHMAFPGGRFEPHDDSLETTAIRETREELSLDLTQGQLIGRLDDLAPQNPTLPPLIIRPFVPNVEVAATYWVPLHALRGDTARAEHVLSVNGVRARFPGYRVAEHVVWGLTERIVRQLLSFIDPQ